MEYLFNYWWLLLIVIILFAGLKTVNQGQIAVVYYSKNRSRASQHEGHNNHELIF